MSRKTINLENVQAAIDKLDANPELLKGAYSELEKCVQSLGLELNPYEVSALLIEIFRTEGVGSVKRAEWFGQNCD